jgi:hypothetical protein
VRQKSASLPPPPPPNEQKRTKLGQDWGAMNAEVGLAIRSARTGSLSFLVTRTQITTGTHGQPEGALPIPI